MKTHRPCSRKRALGSRAPVTVMAFILILLTGCDPDSLLEVTDTVNATPETLDNVAALPTLVAGAIGDFQVGYSGDGVGDAYLSVSSLITDEFYAAGTFTTRIATDQRDQFPTAQGNTSDAAYRNLHRARRALRDATDAVRRLSETPNDPRVSELKALEGYTYLALGEGFCSGIPFSETDRGAPGQFGQPLSTGQVFEAALGVFDEALSAPSPTPAARIGRARALLNLGRAAEAAQVVATVPTTYVYFVRHSANSTRQNNPLYTLQQNRRYGVSDSEGGNGLPFRSAGDPRVPWTRNPAGGFDASFPMFDSRRYVAFGTHVPIATGVEARLIEAEALLLAGDPAWLTRLNDLRSQVGPLMTGMFPHWASVVPGPNNPTTTLAPLLDPGTAGSRLDLLYRERAFWLFNTGTRLGDMRRLVRVHGRASDTVFPVGTFRASVFGNHVAFPVIFDEVNNPNYSISLCDPTQA